MNRKALIQGGYRGVATLLVTLIASSVFGPHADAAFGFTPYRALNTNAVTDRRMDGNPDIATDTNDVWMAVWESNNVLAGGTGSDTDVHFSVSTDSGTTWTAPRAVNTDAKTDARQDGGMRVATDRNGHWIVAWYGTVTTVAYPYVAYDVYVATSADNGATWSAPISLNTSPGWQEYSPSIATDCAGHWVVVWQAYLPGGGSSTADTDIYAARSSDNGATWTAPALLNSSGSTDSGDDEWPCVISNASDEWLVTWSSKDSLGDTLGDDGDILCARSTDNGATWTSPAAVNSAAAIDTVHDEMPRIATDESGIWICTWGASTDEGLDWEGDIFFAKSTDNGATWSDATAANASADSDSDSDDSACLATNGYGQWFIVWIAYAPGSNPFNGASKPMAVVSDDNGNTWSKAYPLKVNAPAKDGENAAPAIASDRDDKWLVVWDIYGKLGGALHKDDDIYLTTTVYPQPLQVLSPNDGEKWARGDTKKIRWLTFPDPDGEVKIELLRNGSLERVIKNATPNDAIFKWKLPNTLTKGGGYSIRVTHTTYTETFDESDATFSIK